MVEQVCCIDMIWGLAKGIAFDQRAWIGLDFAVDWMRKDLGRVLDEANAMAYG